MFYESYGPGTLLLSGALLGAATASPVFGANALMSGRALPTFLELLGPKDYRTLSGLAIMHGLAWLVTIVIGTETAIGLVFDPRYKDFPFAALTMAAVPFAAMTLLDRPRKESALWRNQYLPACFWWRLSIRDLTKGRTTGSRCGLALLICCLRLRCGGRVLETTHAEEVTPAWSKQSFG